jgi:hypothetical protein
MHVTHSFAHKGQRRRDTVPLQRSAALNRHQASAPSSAVFLPHHSARRVLWKISLSRPDIMDAILIG